MNFIYDFFETAGDALSNGLEDMVAFLDKDKHRLKGELLPASTVLSSYHRGFNLNGKNITPQLSRQGVLINGETGSYKSAGAVIRSILTVNGSQIIHDPSGELHQKTSGALARRGYTILQLDFAKPLRSLRYNPILRANTRSQITQLATQLVTIHGDDKTEDASFWNSKAIEALYVVISILKMLAKEYQTLYQASHLLDLMQSKKTAYLVDNLFSEGNVSEELHIKYASIVSQSPNTLSSVLATAQTAVQIFSLDENIAEITATDTIGDFNDLRKEGTVLYIHSSTSKMRYYSKVTSIFISQYFEAFFEELPTPDMEDVYFHLDETPVLSIGSLDIIASNIRKYRGALMLVCQNAQAQLTAKYGKRADAILSNLRTKVYMSADLTTATQLERTLGRYEYNDHQDRDKLKMRNVLTADEIMSLPPDKALIMVSGMRGVLARVKPYFKVRALREMTSIPPVRNSEHYVSGDAIPLLPLKEMYPNAQSDEMA